MASVSVIKLKVRRGSDFDRKLITLDVGELGYVQDVASRRLFVGDGSTRGGNPAGLKFYTGEFNLPVNFSTAQVGDIVFNIEDNKLYSLTGVDSFNFPDYDNPNAYQFIGTRVDNNTIEYTTAGFLRVKDDSITSQKVNDNLFDFTKGIDRVPSGMVSVKTDNNTILFNGSGALYVNINAINLKDINTTIPASQPIDASQIFMTGMPSAPGPLTTGRLWRNPVTGALHVK